MITKIIISTKQQRKATLPARFHVFQVAGYVTVTSIHGERADLRQTAAVCSNQTPLIYENACGESVFPKTLVRALTTNKSADLRCNL